VIRAARVVWAAALLVGIAGACSSNSRTVTPPSHTTAPAGTSGTAGAVSTTASTSGLQCTPSAAYPAGTTHHVMRVGGVTRELLVHMPPHLNRRTMLIVDFHGATSSMQAQEVYSGFDSRADADGFVVATPNGTVIGGVRQWNFLGAPDVDFAVALVRQLVADACVAPGHVFATGISSGGAMTAALACRASQTFDGFAPVSADFYIPAICGHAAQRPYLIFHGTADPVVPYYGGSITTNRDGLAVGGAEGTAAKWAAHNGCGAGRITKTLSSEVVRFTWPGCAAPVIMYKIVGGGHTWPGATITVPLGKTTHQISATDQIVKLFSSV
jgi:polyhydroxybutyrate depolymerase